jgi:hypothetical protein
VGEPISLDPGGIWDPVAHLAPSSMPNGVAPPASVLADASLSFVFLAGLSKKAAKSLGSLTNPSFSIGCNEVPFAFIAMTSAAASDTDSADGKLIAVTTCWAHERVDRFLMITHEVNAREHFPPVDIAHP